MVLVVVGVIGDLLASRFNFGASFSAVFILPFLYGCFLVLKLRIRFKTVYLLVVLSVLFLITTVSFEMVRLGIFEPEPVYILACNILLGIFYFLLAYSFAINKPFFFDLYQTNNRKIKAVYIFIMIVFFIIGGIATLSVLDLYSFL